MCSLQTGGTALGTGQEDEDALQYVIDECCSRVMVRNDFRDQLYSALFVMGVTGHYQKENGLILSSYYEFQKWRKQHAVCSIREV